ncbi:MAG: HAD hydrolase-like protein [Myxococcales bacterium]|nr:HAD hydrolase-like protein [Myxococcales bacterium]
MATLGLRSARDLIEALESGGVSSRELLEHYLERIERLGPALNSVVTLDAERSRKRADQADAARRAGQSWGPLHGLPMTVKDCFETAGLRTTAGAGELSDHVPTVNAVAVQRLLDAGAIVFGKTNTPAWAMDWQTHNKLFGTTNNPWDLERTCGGSSGGSAASVAAGFTALELGSDIGGSVRIPSHCCGVFGHKPSWGIVPVRGHIPGPPGSLIEYDINVIGPLARSADDLEIALRVLMGPLEDRAKGWRLELPEPRAERLQDFRVAAWLDDEACPVDSSVLDILKSTVEALRKTGVSVDDRARPPVSMSEAVTLYQRMLAPIVTSTMTDEQFSALTAVTNSPPSEPAGWIERFSESVGRWPAFPDAPKALAELKRHFKLVILSNVDRASFAHSAEKLGVAFDAVYTAEEIGSYKPDPRNFDLFAYGGAGPTHVGAYAKDIGVKKVVIPMYASVLSAFGIAASDLRRHYSRAQRSGYAARVLGSDRLANCAAG